MTRTNTVASAAGSKLQIRTLINENPDRIQRQLRETIPGWQTAAFEWRSPLAIEQYREYRDRDFMTALGLDPYADRLVGRFWPPRGPDWDALAKVNLSRSTAVLLVEAKSHRSEMASFCRAGKDSIQLIEAAFGRTRQWIGARKYRDWKSPFYQFANRLAHLFFLREECGLEAWLANIYFIGDPYYPTNRGQWDDWLQEVRFELGIGDCAIDGLVELFVPVKGIEK